MKNKGIILNIRAHRVYANNYVMYLKKRKHTYIIGRLFYDMYLDNLYRFRLNTVLLKRVIVNKGLIIHPNVYFVLNDFFNQSPIFLFYILNLILISVKER